VDATVIAQEPALAPHLSAMRAALAAALGVAEERVSVKAKSTDHLGAIGRGEGIAAEAVALIRRAE
jgi:2-C-methyl-D-erythritol 2,4-cyclodiphosphate synthase